MHDRDILHGAACNIWLRRLIKLMLRAGKASQLAGPIPVHITAQRSGSSGQLVAAGGRMMSISTRSASENHGEHTLHWLTQDAADSLLAYLLVAARPSSVTQSLCDLQEGGCAAAGTAPLQSNYLTSVLVTTHYYCTLSSSMLSISR